MTAALKLIFDERARQLLEKGWTAEHDDLHIDGSIAQAASCYASAAASQARGDNPTISLQDWPWEGKYWKPSTDPRRNLVKAAALCLAEIDRLDRALVRLGPTSGNQEKPRD